MQGRSPDEQKRLSLALGATVNELIFETSDQDQATQVQSIQQNLEQKFQAVFDKEHPDDPGLAKSKAKEAAAALSRPEDVNMLVGTANSTYAHLSNGGNYREAAQRLGKDRDTETARQASLATKRAAQKDAAGMGYSSSAMAETSDYFREITEKGQKFNMDDLLRRVGRVTTDRAVLGKYASGMGESFELLSDLKKKHFVTNTDISKMDEPALRKAAGLGADVEIVSDDKIKEERDAAIADMSKNDEASKAAVLEQYKAHVATARGIKLEDVSAERQAGMVSELKSNPKFLAALDKKILGEKRTSRALAEDKASQTMAGEAKDGQEAQAADVNAFEKALLAGADESTLNAGVHATLRLGGIKANEEQIKSLMEAVSDTSPEGGKKLNTVLEGFKKAGVIKDDDTEKFATTALGGIQKGIPLDIAKTLGIAKFTDRELTKELTAQYKAKGMHETEAQAAAKETADKITAQREATEKAGGATPQTTEAQRVEQQKHMEDVLQKDYVENRGMPADKAREQAVIDAAAITKNIGEERAAAGAEGAGDARQQRVDTLEVHAQTVVIKSGKVDGEGGGRSGDSTAAPQTQTIFDKVLSGNVEGALKDIKGGDGASLMDSAFVTGLTTLEGKPPVQVKPGEEKPDVALSKPEPAPTPPAPEPEKVAQASGEQLKHDKGVATNEPAAASAAAPAAQEKKTAYDLTGADIVTALGGADAVRGSKEKQQELLQSDGLRKDIKAIKKARERGDTVDEENALEPFEVGMRDAIASGLIPHPVDEDGDPITDFESDEAIAAAEKHLEKYLPKGKESTEKKEEKRYTADELSKLHPEGVKNEFGETEPWSPGTSRRLPTGSYTHKLGGNYVDDKTGREYDRYGNEAGGTYSADGNNWSAGGALPTGEEKPTTQKTTDEPKQASRPTTAPTAPSSMAALIDAAKASPAGQAVLTGATAMYEKYAPNAVKDMVSNYGTETRDPNKEQYRLQEVYAENHARYAAATTSVERKNAERHKKAGITLMAHHNAAREAGIDTKSGAYYDEHAGTINGKKVDKDAVDRHVRLLEEKAEKDPLSIVSDDVQKTLKMGKYSESAAVKTANDEQLKKSAGAPAPADKKSGVSSANVSPEAAAKTAADAAQAAAQGPVASTVGNAPLATAVPETEMTKPNSAPINRVHAMSANTPVGPAPVAGGGGGGMGGSSGGNMTINGTLTLNGLQEAILNAQGGQVMQTDGGAPIVIDPIKQQGVPASPKTYA
jgi:hypothetical protein